LLQGLLLVWLKRFLVSNFSNCLFNASMDKIEPIKTKTAQLITSEGNLSGFQVFIPQSIVSRANPNPGAI
jgi:hypothetical protein|tara:strand:- start:415 stop:624 length:210 start_codon:yes stop_codon:yes gene_type:complete